MKYAVLPGTLFKFVICYFNSRYDRYRDATVERNPNSGLMRAWQTFEDETTPVGVLLRRQDHDVTVMYRQQVMQLSLPDLRGSPDRVELLEL